jgi:hypothetical protein
MPMRAFSSCRVGVCLLALVVGAGCGGKGRLHPVEGVVTLNGTPVEGATVMFVPEGDKGEHAHGLTDAAGHFTLKTNNQNGVYPGKYKVLVSKSSVTIDQAGGGGEEAAMERKGGGQMRQQWEQFYKKTGGKKPKVVLPPIYSDGDRTPFHYTVPVEGEVKLEMEKKAG